MASSIDRFAGRAISILNGPFDNASQDFGAFCARVVLENCSAALVGRLDPFRLIYLAEFQTQAGFEYGKPSRSGFRWAGDVVPDDKLPADLWGSDHDITKVSRALFSPYAEHAYWKPAIEASLDAISNQPAAIFGEITAIDPDRFVRETRGHCGTIYSTLSKGVHWEFFASAVTLDEVTLKDTIRDALLIMAGMGFISHFVPTVYRRLDTAGAVAAYTALRGSFS